MDMVKKKNQQHNPPPPPHPPTNQIKTNQPNVVLCTWKIFYPDSPDYEGNWINEEFCIEWQAAFDTINTETTQIIISAPVAECWVEDEQQPR